MSISHMIQVFGNIYIYIYIFEKMLRIIIEKIPNYKKGGNA